MADKKDLEEIKQKLNLIKEKTKEIKVILPTSPGEDIKKNFNAINKILNRLLEEE